MVSDELYCTNCNYLLEVPMKLPCGHVFCEWCLEMRSRFFEEGDVCHTCGKHYANKTLAEELEIQVMKLCRDYSWADEFRTTARQEMEDLLGMMEKYRCLEDYLAAHPGDTKFNRFLALSGGSSS